MAQFGEIYHIPSEGELMRLLECPICSEVALPPLFNCNNGHLICSLCSAQLDSCGICRAPLSDIRNFAVEAIVNSSLFKCKYESDGCTKRMRGEVYKVHVESCDFRSVICNHSTGTKCINKAISFNEFIKHMTEIHKLTRYEMPSTGLQVTEISTALQDQLWPQILMSTENKYFFRRQRIVNGMLQVYVVYFGSESESAGFKVQIAFCGSAHADERKIEVDWSIPVHSFRKSVQEVEDSGLFAAIPVAQVRHIGVPNSENDQWQWKARYTIRMVNP